MLAAALIPRSLDPLQVRDVLHGLAAIAPGWVYVVVGLGAALENIFPPVPADTFVLFGAFLSESGKVTGLGVFLVTWSSNTLSALASYGVARRWGNEVMSTRPGRWLLRPRQLRHLARLYDAHGSKIIFGSRFLPAFRALVPFFAGISRLSFVRTAIPVALASGIWYGILVYVGVFFGRNWRSLFEALKGVNTLLLVVAGAVAVIVAVFWWRTRHPSDDAEEGGAQG
jgi:membrane protein DedA with SNARE-associated domain